jgi:hypothetical protein
VSFNCRRSQNARPRLQGPTALLGAILFALARFWYFVSNYSCSFDRHCQTATTDEQIDNGNNVVLK